MFKIIKNTLVLAKKTKDEEGNHTMTERWRCYNCTHCLSSKAWNAITDERPSRSRSFHTWGLNEMRPSKSQQSGAARPAVLTCGIIRSSLMYISCSTPADLHTEKTKFNWEEKQELEASEPEGVWKFLTFGNSLWSDWGTDKGRQWFVFSKR